MLKNSFIRVVDAHSLLVSLRKPKFKERVDSKKNNIFYITQTLSEERLKKERVDVLTLDRSSSFVIMTTVALRCSHIILQKSPKVSGRDPCVAI